jgi:hypothetical protein
VIQSLAKLSEAKNFKCFCKMSKIYTEKKYFPEIKITPYGAEKADIYFLKDNNKVMDLFKCYIFFGKQKQGTWFGSLNMRNINLGHILLD